MRLCCRVERELGRAGDLRVEPVDGGVEVENAEDIARQRIGACDIRHGATGARSKPRYDTWPATVDDGVGELRRNDLAPETMTLDRVGVFILHRFREVAPEFFDEVGVIRHVRSEEMVVKRELGIGEQHRDLRPGEILAACRAGVDFGVGWQPFDLAVEAPLGFQPAHQVLHFRVCARAHALVERERERLQVVVAEHELADLVGHGGQQYVALLARQAAVALGFGERDLEIDLDVRGVDASRIVDGVGVELGAMPRRLDARRLRHPEVGAFADHLRADLGAGDADGIVGAIACIGISFRGGADVSTDAAEPEQIDLCPENGGHHGLRRRILALEAEQRLHFRRERDFLEGSREDAAALRDQRRIIILPARAWLLEEALALGKALRRIRRGIDEDIAMIEGRDEADLLGEQHAVAKDVAGHVADAGHGEGHGLDVDIDLAEMALHRFPRTARSDAHLLVVVAGGAAGGEGIGEPMAARIRDGVGSIGEGSGALVGGHNEVGIVAVIADGPGRGHDALARNRVREIEKRGDEGLVARGSLGEPGVAVRGWRKVLRHEATLCTDRHNDGVLHLLGLHQPEDFRPEIHGTVGPPETATRDLAETQVQPLHLWRGHEDLIERFGQRQVINHAAGEFECDCRATRLEDVGAQRGEDEVQHPPEDAVVVEAGDLVDLGEKCRLHGFGEARAVALLFLQVGVEAQREKLREALRRLRIAGERIGDVDLAVGHADLAEVAGIGTQDIGLARCKGGFRHQHVEAVALQLAGENTVERGFERAFERGNIDRAALGALKRHIVQPMRRGALTLGHDAVGPLVDDGEAEVFQHWHAARERNRVGVGEDLEAGAVLVVASLAIEIEGEGRLVVQALQRRDVDDRFRGREGLAIGGIEGIRPGAAPGSDLVCRCLHGEAIAEIVGPGADDGGDIGLQRLAGDHRGFPLDAANDVMRAREWTFGIGGIGSREPPVVDLREVSADPETHAGIVAILRDIDHHGDEAVEAICPRQRPETRPLGKREHVHREAEQRVEIDLKQLVTRIAFEHVRQCLAGMAGRIEPGAIEHARDLVPEIGHCPCRTGIGRGREQADNTQLAFKLASAVEDLHADVVEIDAAMDRRFDVRLGHKQRGWFLQEGADFRCHHHEFATAAQHLHIGIAQDAKAFGGNRVRQHFLIREAIFAHAEQGEVIRQQPIEKLHGFGDLVRRQKGRCCAVTRRDLGKAGAHRNPVGDGSADVAEDRGQAFREIGACGLVEHSPDVDVQQAFALHGREFARGGNTEKARQRAVRGSLDREDRMRDQRDRETTLAELGEGRGQQERHVVIHDLDQRAGETEVRERFDADLGLAMFTPREGLQRGFRQLQPLGGIDRCGIFGIDAAEERLHELLGSSRRRRRRSSAPRLFIRHRGRLRGKGGTLRRNSACWQALGQSCFGQ